MYVYIYTCFTLLYSRNLHDIVKQLYTNKKFFLIIRISILLKYVGIPKYLPSLVSPLLKEKNPSFPLS